MTHKVSPRGSKRTSAANEDEFVWPPPPPPQQVAHFFSSFLTMQGSLCLRCAEASLFEALPIALVEVSRAPELAGGFVYKLPRGRTQLKCNRALT